MPRVTVLISTFNRKKFLEQAVETVRLQTHEPLECVVVDDGSTDGTRDFLDSLDYDALKTVYHEENRGQSVARNTGIENASGEYVLFLDSDDILYPRAAETLIEAMESQPYECAGAFASTKLVKSNGRVTKRDVPDGVLTEPTFKNARAIGGLSCRMFRRNALEDVGGFDESLSRRVDLDLYLKLLKKYTLLGVDEVYCERRIHESQMSNDRDDVDRSRRKVAEKHQLDDVQYDRKGY
jgi:glycosyltransferase involved in cell wall biosynthesis